MPITMPTIAPAPRTLSLLESIFELNLGLAELEGEPASVLDDVCERIGEVNSEEVWSEVLVVKAMEDVEDSSSAIVESSFAEVDFATAPV